MRIIHLSDLHYNHLDTSQPKVIRALCEDLKSVALWQEVNLIVFSGDIARRGMTDKITVKQIHENVILPILACFPIVPKIMFCPGNHDVDLKARDEMYAPIFDNISSPQAANKLVEKDPAKLEDLLAHLDGYKSLVHYSSPTAYVTNPFFYTTKLEVNGIAVGIVSLNSAWMSKGGGNADYGNLFIGERQIDLALKEVGDCAIKIAVMHHSLNWLNPQEGNIAQRMLATNFQAVFCGHNHETNAASMFWNLGSVFISNTGCLYETREYFNGYSIVDLDLIQEKWIVSAREYFYQRETFDISPRFSESGVSEFPMRSRPGDNLIVISSNVISEVQERASAKLLSFTASDIAPRQIGAMFVEPLMADVSEKQFVAAEGKALSYTTLSQLALLQESLVIVGKKETGKTLLLHHVAANRFIEFHSKARIGLVVDLSLLARNTEAAILAQLGESTGGEMRRRDIIKLLTDGHILVCVDNFHVHSPVQTAFLKGFCQKYPNSRYIIVAPEEFYENINGSSNVPDIGIPVQQVYIHSFRRKQIREMVGKWFGDSTEIRETRLNSVNQLLSRLNVPATPFLISVLLWVLEQRPNASPENQAAAVEVLIDGLLEKFQESKSRLSFDSNIQRHFLSDLAVNLDSEGVEWISRISFDAFVVNYFMRKGLTVSTHGFADELLRKGLLYGTTDRIAFKFDCFRAYFLALRFVENPSLWRKALSKEQVHRYSGEIDYFTGLHRDRKDVLETAIALCTELFPASGFTPPADALNTLSEGAILISNAKLNNLEQKLLEKPYDSNEREERLTDLEQPSHASVDHDESRKRQLVGGDSNQLVFMAALRALSIVVRNSELVDDVKLKQQGVELALTSWANIALSTTSLLEKADLSDFKLPANFKSSKSEAGLRQALLLMFPQAMLHLMIEVFATPKIESFLMNVGAKFPPLTQCFAALMAFDGGSKFGVAMVKEILKEHGNKKFIVQVVFFKLLGSYYFQSLDGAQVTGIRECLADAFMIFRGGNGREQSATRNLFLQNLDKAGLVQEIKSNEQDK